MDTGWQRLGSTIDRIQSAYKISATKARLRLIEACAAGEVRARWFGEHYGRKPAIPRNDWIGADIDLTTERVIKANSESMGLVEFAIADLKDWLGAGDLVMPSPSARETAEEACLRFIRESQADKLKSRGKLFEAAKTHIRDLTKKEFDRAWQKTPDDLKRPAGRPPRTNTPQ
jgi:hypothetical protein